jgi:hypothetical protein
MNKIKIGSLTDLFEESHDLNVCIYSVDDESGEALFEGQILDIPNNLLNKPIYCWCVENDGYFVIWIDL